MSESASHAEEVVRRSHERSDSWLERLDTAVREKLEELKKQGSIADVFEPRDWRKEKDDDG